MKESKIEKFFNTYGGKKLIKKYSLNEEGLWEVLGEDPNPDWAGTHISPHIGFFEGKLGDVVAQAVDLPGFWQWGSGGEIRKVSVRKASQR